MVTGEHENVMTMESYEDGDWIVNYFDGRASAVQKLVTVELSYDSKFFEDALFAIAAETHNLKLLYCTSSVIK